MSAPPMVVPWVASWTSEKTTIPPLRYRRGVGALGIAYGAEKPHDRDANDILWQRKPESRGVGKPLLGVVHSGRQRRGMEELLCQVCGEPADVDHLGVLWLVEANTESDFPEWPEGMGTTHPPICAGCLDVARRSCPHLLKGSAVLRVGRPEIVAVAGRRYLAGGLVPRLIGEGLVLVDSLAAGWVLASQIVMELSDCTVVDVS